MNKRLFVAGLPFTSTSDDLKNHFSSIGTVVSAAIIMDRDTGRSKGFGFVEMEKEEDAEKAISTLNDSDFGGRKLIVAEAKPQEQKHDRFEKRGGFQTKRGPGSRRNFGRRREGGPGNFGRSNSDSRSFDRNGGYDR